MEVEVHIPMVFKHYFVVIIFMAAEPKQNRAACKYEYLHSQQSTAGLSNAAPVIYFPGALIYSAGFNVIRISRKKYVSIFFIALP
jgi:hypothetical protein